MASTRIPQCRIVSFRTGRKTKFQQTVLKNSEEKGYNAVPMVVAIGNTKYSVVGNFYLQKYEEEDKLYCQFYFDANNPPKYSQKVMQEVINKLSLMACKLRLNKAELVIYYPP